MASIAKLPNGTWRARFYDNSRKQQSKVFARRIDAQHWIDEQTVALRTGSYVEPRSSQATIAELATIWIDSDPSWTASTKARNRSILDRHILPKWGSMPLARIGFEEVQQWVASYSSGNLAGGTVRKIAGVLSSLLRFAVASRKLSANPMTGVKLPKQAIARRRYLDVDQVDALAEAAGDNADIVLTLAYCGLRFGELAALRVSGVDLRRRRVQIIESVTEVNGELSWSAPKDHQGRSVPFPDFMTEAFAQRTAGKDPQATVFESPRGGTLRVRNMRRDWFDAAARAAGVGGLTPHELRHTAASMAVAAGASVLSVQRMLGHEKPSVTLDVYADLFDDDLDAVAQRLGEARAHARKARLRHGAATQSSGSIATAS